MSPHELPHAPEAWEAAPDEELVSAPLERKRFVNPGFIAWLEQHRPAALRRSLLLFRDLGGVLGAPAKRFLKDKP